MPPAVVQKAILSIQKLMFQDVPKGSISNMKNVKTMSFATEIRHLPKIISPEQIPISLFSL